MGINNIGINKTNIILIALYIIYSVLTWLFLTYVLSGLLASNLIGITKHRHFLMRGLQPSFWKRHSLSNSYHSNTEWVTYQRKLSHMRTSQIQTVNIFRSQKSIWPLNCPHVQRSHLVCKIMTLLCCSVFLCCKTLKHNTQ